ncbi:hypothetical protein F4827_003238 [Paraburkholderia bannensis]|uniref:Uncharacterized protein n=1 Tax=Paraburkholderia bannensis TaxID=765414 RepID=A0A7W9TXS3_9BURK|nr:hypothetical protein [Paraburkholderia sp. WP4_3_2]MBB6103383.1 hypothetical protein [Paraburkholderia bannensis]
MPWPIAWHTISSKICWYTVVSVMRERHVREKAEASGTVSVSRKRANQR